MARIAKSLNVLRDQVNKAHPDRSTLSDGWIGDEAHQGRKSDHNPNTMGVVQALDITHDLAHGVDTWAMAETLRLNKDTRIKYVISNGRIFYTYGDIPWQWQQYTGSNAHAHHVHVSVSDVKSVYDDESPWQWSSSQPVPARPPEVRPVIVPADLRRRMAKEIVKYEARRDKAGHLAIYVAPDGSQEVAGINSTYHPAEYAKLTQALAAGQYDAAERAAEDYVLSYTAPVIGWVTDFGLEFYLRDSFFNRGPTGAARILQRALGVADDGEIGPMTRDRLAAAKPNDVLTKLRSAREQYEIDVLNRSPGHPQWNGLVNRWNNALTAARKFAVESGSKPSAGKETAGAVVAGGAVIGAKEAGDRFGWQGVAVVIAIALIIGFVIWKVRTR